MLDHPLIGLFGGTFDPIHLGHLATIQELNQSLGFDELRLIPSSIPPHRLPTSATAEQRLAMVRLAAGDLPGVVVDDREVIREGLSYSVDTLISLRHELGDEVALCLVMGMDAFCLLDTWHEWERLADLAHIIVMNRPGYAGPESGVMARFLHAREASEISELRAVAFGRVLVQPVTPMDVSATEIRALIAEGNSAGAFLPDVVGDYIQSHSLYQTTDRA